MGQYTNQAEENKDQVAKTKKEKFVNVWMPLSIGLFVVLAAFLFGQHTKENETVPVEKGLTAQQTVALKTVWKTCKLSQDNSEGCATVLDNFNKLMIKDEIKDVGNSGISSTDPVSNLEYKSIEQPANAKGSR